MSFIAQALVEDLDLEPVAGDVACARHAVLVSELDDDHAADRLGCGTGEYLRYAGSAHRLAEVSLRRRTGNDRLDLPAGRVRRSRPAAKVCACRTTAAPSWCWRWQRSTRVACAIPADRGGWVMPTCQCRMYWKRIARRWLGLGELHDPD